MSRSKPFDLVNFIFKPVWESVYKESYRGTSRDLKEAKEFLMMNENIFDEIPEFQEHAVEYLKSKFDGWIEQRHPCWGFLRNYNAYAPKIKKVSNQKSCQYCHSLFDPMKIVGHELNCEQAPKPASPEAVREAMEEITPERINSLRA